MKKIKCNIKRTKKIHGIQGQKGEQKGKSKYKENRGNKKRARKIQGKLKERQRQKMKGKENRENTSKTRGILQMREYKEKGKELYFYLTVNILCSST